MTIIVEENRSDAAYQVKQPPETPIHRVQAHLVTLTIGTVPQ